MGMQRPLSLILPLLIVAAQAQVGPTPYHYDCRRSNVGCANGGTCNPANGACLCADGYLGHNCQLLASTVVTCTQDQCENNAKCTNESACFCNSDTYGSTCANARVTVWCTRTEMFVNIYPHGDASFAGDIFLSTPDADGRTRPECQFNSVTGVNLSSYPYVTDVQGSTPELSGVFRVLPFNQPADTSDFCEVPEKVDNEAGGTTDYVHRVVVEYNGQIISSLDQVFAFNCSVSNVTNVTTLSTANGMSVSIFDEDYQKVNVTDKVEPILFEVRNPVTNRIVTNDVSLGDPLDLVFILQASSAESAENASLVVADFKVTLCTATNSQPVTDGQSDPPPSIDFLVDECPGPGSELLYRGNIVQREENGQKQTVIPLNAFRFVGDHDEVSFTCTITLCTGQEVLENEDACKKATCPGDTIATDGSGETDNGNSTNTDSGSDNGNSTDTGDSAGSGNSTDTMTGGETGTGNSTDAGSGNSTDTADGPGNSTDTAEGSGNAPLRKKRSMEDEKEKEMTQTIQVSSGLEKGPKDGATDSEAEEVNCQGQSEVMVVIIIFAVVLIFLLIVVIALVLRMVKSRVKVVDAASEMTSETGSRRQYSLPRLSFAGSTFTSF